MVKRGKAGNSLPLKPARLSTKSRVLHSQPAAYEWISVVETFYSTLRSHKLITWRELLSFPFDRSDSSRCAVAGPKTLKFLARTHPVTEFLPFLIPPVAAYANHISFNQRPRRTMMDHGRIICEGHTTPVCQKKKSMLIAGYGGGRFAMHGWPNGTEKKKAVIQQFSFLPFRISVAGGRWQRHWIHPKKNMLFGTKEEYFTMRYRGRRVVAHMPPLSLPRELIYLFCCSFLFFVVVTFSDVYIIKLPFTPESRVHVTSIFDEFSIKWEEWLFGSCAPR